MPVSTSTNLPAHPRPPVRKALSIAVKYASLREYQMDLEGTHNDPRLVRELLVDKFQYKPEDIVVLIDDESQPEHTWPTKENIEKAMRELVAGAQAGDHFVFHFSGHGALVKNEDGTEKSGFDEVIWPVDVLYRTDDDFDNYIKDDEIHDVLVEHIPVGAHFMMIFDCCHSGTMADLPNESTDYFPETPISASSSSSIPSTATIKNIRVRGTQDTNNQDDGTGRKTTKDVFAPTVPIPATTVVDETPAYADVTSWSACRDDQVTLGDRRGGIFVKALYRALWHKPVETHEELLSAVTREIAKITAAYNAHTPDASEKYTINPEMESLQSMRETLKSPLEI